MEAFKMSDESIRRGGDVSPMRNGQGTASELSHQNGTLHYRPGILIFSRRQQLLQVNRRALELTGHLDPAEGKLTCRSHSGPVCELGNAIQAALDHRRNADIWELFELKRVIFESERKILVRGFGLSDRRAPGNSRIVIVLEELDLRQKQGEPQRQAMGPPQERGREVIQESGKRRGRSRSVRSVRGGTAINKLNKEDLSCASRR
jgi:hypothetical protein